MQNRSTEECSKLKRSGDMTSSGKNGLNIRTNASPKWDMLMLFSPEVVMFTDFDFRTSLGTSILHDNDFSLSLSKELRHHILVGYVFEYFTLF